MTSTKITRRALPKSAETQWVPSYELLRDGKVIATAHCTGRPGVDNYPWNWSLAEGVESVTRPYTNPPLLRTKRFGTVDTLRSAIEEVGYWAA